MKAKKKPTLVQMKKWPSLWAGNTGSLRIAHPDGSVEVCYWDMDRWLPSRTTHAYLRTGEWGEFIGWIK